MDTTSMRTALATMTPEERSAFIERVKAATGGYVVDKNGNYILADRVSRSDPLVRETEQLMIPSIRAGRVPVEDPDFASSMQDLGFSEEDILDMLVYHASRQPVEPPSIAPRVWWGILIVLFLAALLRACIKLS